MYDYEHIAKLAQIGASDETIAWFMGMGLSHFKMMRQAEPELEQAIIKGRLNMRTVLHAKQFEAARRGDTKMLIWLGKNYLGQTEQVRNTVEVQGPSRAVEIAEKSARKNPNRITEVFPELLEH